MSPLQDLRPTTIIMIALAIWGVALAIGATGQFVDATLFNPVRSGIVIAFVAAFLLAWGSVLRTQARPDNPPGIGEAAGPARPLNRAALVSLGFVLLASLLWIGAVVSWQAISRSGTTLLGWFSALSYVGGVTMGMVALADRRPRRFRALGWLGLLAGGVSVYVFVSRMG